MNERPKADCKTNPVAIGIMVNTGDILRDENQSPAFSEMPGFFGSDSRLCSRLFVKNEPRSKFAED